jgi:membrane protein DedA with SNARE-associated domain
MDALSAFLVAHGYPLLFVWVLAEALGIPVPSVPAVLTSGALAQRGYFAFWTAWLTCVGAFLLGDTVWHMLGRRGGMRVLRFLCRISLEPDSCVNSTQTRFSQWGPRILLISKFVPGLNTVAAPLSGVARVSLKTFLAMDFVGAGLWSMVYLGLGHAFSQQLEWLLLQLQTWGRNMAVALGVLFVVWLALKWLQRAADIRYLRQHRVTPEEVKQRLDAGEPLTIVDLRQDAAFDSDRRMLPGAVRWSLSDLEAHLSELDTNASHGELILYCT